ncbi:protein of unknown function [Methylotuvimicrobium alcaliphilum 20Z]|uniref:Uncharacterized protein n=1 Tax=Methylotuvimicrobium alcaliphilum (strain DSM 19304 / NCIMB 14124 / VKM B-2133 / 20Z) TaxID=1091494 RepID=G4SZR7_META2|nr:protein of unknown function [Methylotuvimicrobium alcaliphilum 20Z]
MWQREVYILISKFLQLKPKDQHILSWMGSQAMHVKLKRPTHITLFPKLQLGKDTPEAPAS